MKFGVRECVDVVFRAKTAQKIGNKIFYKNEPVIYFDTLKTSSFEGAATTVYAQGGRGNPRLISWDGERTVTFTMEDALISPVGFSILSGAGIVDASAAAPIYQHVTERTTVADANGNIGVVEDPFSESGEDAEATIYVFKLTDNGEVNSEPILYKASNTTISVKGKTLHKIQLADKNFGVTYNKDGTAKTTLAVDEPVLVDYYTKKESGAFQIDISPDKFGGAFYVEAGTLWRDQATGKDYPAEFVIPNVRVQSNFTFTMASTGDPSSFTFTCDAFPDYTRFDKTKKVLASIQIIGSESETEVEDHRTKTYSDGITDASASAIVSKNVLSIGDSVVTTTQSATIDLATLFNATPATGNTVTITYSAGEGLGSISNGVLTIGSSTTAGTYPVTATAVFKNSSNITVATKYGTIAVEVIGEG